MDRMSASAGMWLQFNTQILTQGYGYQSGQTAPNEREIFDCCTHSLFPSQGAQKDWRLNSDMKCVPSWIHVVECMMSLSFGCCIAWLCPLEWRSLAHLPSPRLLRLAEGNTCQEMEPVRKHPEVNISNFYSTHTKASLPREKCKDGGSCEDEYETLASVYQLGFQG